MRQLALGFDVACWAQSGRFASEPEAFALDCALRFESPPTAAVYGVLISRFVFLSVAIVLSLLPVVAPAAPAHNGLAPLWAQLRLPAGLSQPE
jgi:hypothetical protein